MSVAATKSLLPSFRREALTYYRRLARVQERVLASGEIPPLSEAAELACVSPGYFSQFFADKVGIPYTRWARVIRLEKAIDAMGEANLSIAEIAEACGYSDVRALQRDARALTGVTPSELKRRVSPLSMSF
jgi:AraC-like DNA-binding protein